MTIKGMEEDETQDRGDLFVPDEELDNESELDDLGEDEDEEAEDLAADDEDLEDDEDDEDEDGEDADEEDEEDSEEDSDEAPNEDQARIPRSRLNKVIEERNTEREERARLQGRIDALEELAAERKGDAAKVTKDLVVEFDFKGKQIESANALIDGDVELYAKIQSDIDTARTTKHKADLKATREDAKEVAKSQTDSALESQKLDIVVERSVKQHSFLDADSDEYNEEAVETVNALMDNLVASGSTKSQALTKAVKRLAPLFSTEPLVEKKASLGKKRKVANRKKAASANQKQPPTVKKGSKAKSNRDLDAINVTKMTDRDYSKLSLRERKTLRGD